jgi:cytochrome c2
MLYQCSSVRFYTMRSYRVILLVLLVMLGACGSGGAAGGDPAGGQKLFSGETPMGNADAPPCSQCHAVVPGGEASIGNNLSNIGNRAATTVSGQAAEDYLRTSIIDPDAHLSGGFQEGIMYRGYQRDLTPQQITDLVAYMLTLKSGQDS